MIINAWTELKISYRGDRRKGGLFNYIAKLLGVGSRTVERVIGAHKVGDYHKEMNATVFEEWMESVLTWIKEK